MKRHIRTAGLCGIVTLALGSLLWGQPSSSLPQDAPDFTLHQCVLADSLSLSDLLGHPALLFFFDAGDRDCVPAYRFVRNWRLKYRADSLTVIGIHCPTFEPLKEIGNAVTAVAEADIKIPVGMDFDSKMRRDYGIETLPAFVLLDPDGKIIFRASDPAGFEEMEKRIQQLLRKIKPGTVLPFLYRPEEDAEAGPDHGKAAGMKLTPTILFGLAPGTIVGADSSGLGKYMLYTDPRGRENGKVYLSGRWRVDQNSINYTQSEDSYIRIVYTGKDVWLLAEPVGDEPVKVVVKQDRSYLHPELWGEDIKVSIEDNLPYIIMRYAVPRHIVSNAKMGTHELTLIPSEGEVNFYYIHLE
jgi:peroxiredoxin